MPVLHAYAKINLSLEVLGRRDDGYHEIVSLLQTVSLADELQLEPAASLSFTCSDPELESGDNLVMRAARMLIERSRPDLGCCIHLEKRIPHGAGLGGGSSDAAAALLGLSSLWKLRLGHDALHELAAALGSDVPFFLHGGTALVSGRGEVVQPLPDSPVRWYVLAKPPVPLSTAAVYSELLTSEYADGRMTRRRDENVNRLGINSLQAAAFRLCPEAERCYHALCAAASDVVLSGSGPTSVGLVGGESEASDVARRVRSEGFWTAAVRTVSRGELQH